MSPRRSHLLVRLVLGAIAVPSAASAQGYPKIDPKLQQATDERKGKASRHAKEIFESHQAELAAWAAKGKPYLPGAGLPHELPQASIPAFPGAWGGGMYSFGGRGGKVIVVTTLDDSGPGSFRAACEAAGPRIVVFNVAGIIKLESVLRIRAPYITIAGNTAPGDGVCIAGNTVELDTHDVIIRHMRFRRGETDVTDRNDSIGGNPVGNIMIDHVSASWGLDENMSMYRHMYSPPEGGKDLKLPTVNITIQNSIFSECLNTFHHAFGSTIGGLNSTFHHNLWASNAGRNPSVGMYGDFTFVNNVLFNWRHRTIDGGDHRSLYNIFNNWFKPGPATPDGDIRHRLLKPESERSKTVIDNFGKAYVSGNVVEGDERVTKDNWDGGVQPDVRGENAGVALGRIKTDVPLPHARLPIQNAKEAYDSVLSDAGATLPRRDAVDARVVESVRTGQVAGKVRPETRQQLAQPPYTEQHISEQIELIGKGIITNPDQVGGYPLYQGKPYGDGDHDGIPDDWEKSHGLDPGNADDAVSDLNGDGYANIEDFINGLDPQAPKKDWRDLKNNVDPRG
jgi:pectate lyase